MKIAVWNIQRGLPSKIQAIEHLADSSKINIIALTEADSDEDSNVSLCGYDCFRSPENPARVVVYCLKDLKVKDMEFCGDIPAVVINSAQCSFGFVYGEFTANAYTELRHIVTDKMRCAKLIDFMNWVNLKAKKNCIISGDYNIHWEA